MSPLTYLIAAPLIMAGLLLLVPRQQRVTVRAAAVFTTGMMLLLALKLFLQFDSAAEGFQFVQRLPWLDSLGISYAVGVDGLNVGLILMGAIVAFAAACVSWEIREREKEFYILLLVMTGGILGAFASLDLFFFYCFHELALVPTFLMIGIWGRGERKNYATFQITLYLSIGALLALIGLLALYFQSGLRTFDLERLTAQLRQQPLPVSAQQFIFPLLLFGFGILVGLWPFHSWAPLGYGSAPTPTAMLHAGVLKKFGVYGLLRIALPLLPAGARDWMSVVAWLALGNILYCGLVAMRQKDLNLLIGNSSVAHMGFVFLGLASLNVIGITGAMVIMVAHGLLAALSFAVSGYLYQKAGTTEMAQFGGLLRQLPFVGTVLILALLAGCGVPGFANFVGEILVFFGAWPTQPTVTILAVWGALIIGAVYMLRAIRQMLHGPPSERWSGLADAANFWRKLPMLLLVVGLLAFGCVPRWLTDKLKPNAERIVRAAAVPGRDSMLADRGHSPPFDGREAQGGPR
jgi:NADH-quinone oxidoreductase subunit M